VVGDTVGAEVGEAVGLAVGVPVGAPVVTVGNAVGVIVVGEIVGAPEVGELVGAEVVMVTEATPMVPYVDPIELKTLEGVETRAEAKVEAAVVSVDPKPIVESTTTLPEDIDVTTTADVATPAVAAMSDL